MLSAMSFSKHQPCFKKRKIDKEAPPFPCLPRMISWDAMLDFAKKSQDALVSVSSQFSQNSFFLPLISPHGLQYRFPVEDDGSIFYVKRKPFADLKREVDNFNPSKFYGICVRGPVGVGKSYLLYFIELSGNAIK